MEPACPQCGATNNEDAPTCFRCGTRLRCANCGLPVETAPIVSPLGGFCSGCGARVDRIPKIRKPWFPAVIRILALLVLGAMGFVCALGGTCILILGGVSGSAGSTVPIAIGIFAIGGVCAFGMVKLIQKM